MSTKNKIIGFVLVVLVIISSTIFGVSVTSNGNSTSQVMVLTDNQMSQIAGGDLFGFIEDVFDTVCETAYDGGELVWKGITTSVGFVIDHSVGYLGNDASGKPLYGWGLQFPCRKVLPGSSTNDPFGYQEHNPSPYCTDDPPNLYTVPVHEPDPEWPPH